VGHDAPYGLEEIMLNGLRAHRAVRCSLVALVAIFVSAGSVAAASADVSRQILVDDVEVEHTLNPCSGTEGTFTRTFNGVVQTVTRPDGSTLFRGWIRADDATFVPDDPSEPIFTGRETVHVSTVTNGSSATSTFVLHFWASSPDGTRTMFKEVEHMTFSASGNTVEFEKPVAIC
jgi:hypothetical protein